MALRHRDTALALAGCALAGAGAHAQMCSRYWTVVGGVTLGHGAVMTFNDGSGPAVYANIIPYSGPYGATAGRWDGHSWTLLNDGLPPRDQVGPFAVLDDGAGARLYASGVWSDPVAHYWLVRWNGHSWELPTPGFFVWPQFGVRDAPVVSFNDGTGVVTYGFQCQSPSGSSCGTDSVVRWTGTSWVVIGVPNLGGAIDVLAGIDVGQGHKLFAAGVFSSMGGVPAVGVAMWNGTAWQPLGVGINGLPRALCQYDDGRGPALYVGGNMTTAMTSTTNSVSVHGIARWDGQSWSDVGGGITSGGIAQINGLAVFDDGRGPALYASGYFSQIGGVNAHDIARWDGHTWEALGNGFGGPADSFAVFNDGRGPSLFVAGEFNNAGGGATPGLAQWVGCPNCYANCDNSTRSPRLNVLDFMCFLNKFAARDPYANCTVDATIDMADFMCFLSKFAQGCP